MPLSIRILLALLLGVAAGAVLAATRFGGLENVLSAADVIGTLWLNALRMTIIPLIFALVVTSINSAGETASGGRLAARTLLVIFLLLAGGAILSMVVSPLLLAIWPLNGSNAQGLLQGIGSSTQEVAPAAPISEMITGLIPTNPVAAASEGAMLPFVFFTLVFGFAVSRLKRASRVQLTPVLNAVAETMLIIIHWVLLLAPIGVFALAVRLGATGGASAAGALAHYVAITTIMGVIATLVLYPLLLLRRMSVLRFAAGIAPAQVVAASTASSLASLPIMIERAQKSLGVPSAVAGLALPLAVTMMRYTSPFVNIAVGLWLAQLYGLEPTWIQIMAVGAAAIMGSIAAVGLPGGINLFITYVPICTVLGLPVEVLPLLLAVDAIPDISKTVGNVTADLTLAVLVTEPADVVVTEYPAAASAGAPSDTFEPVPDAA
jgi:Na+/H+-dicarboxylate symporter